MGNERIEAIESESTHKSPIDRKRALSILDGSSAFRRQIALGAVQLPRGNWRATMNSPLSLERKRLVPKRKARATFPFRGLFPCFLSLLRAIRIVAARRHCDVSTSLGAINLCSLHDRQWH